MRTYLLNLALLLTVLNAASAQTRKYTPKIEPCNCRFMVDSNFIKIAPTNLQAIYGTGLQPTDSSFKTRCGYLVVPENRSKAASKMIRLPFIWVESKNPARRKDPVLYTAGGPGGSSLGWALEIMKSDIIKDRDCIAFEQRGTRYAWPYLRTFDMDKAIKEAYRKNLDKDSMMLVGVKNTRRSLEKRGIDLTGYTSDETVSDIHDLIKTLEIDSVNLFGGSYSGGLMTAVLQRDPTHIRSLVINSPLPMFTPIDEDEPANFNEALTLLFRHVAQDSTDKVRYANLNQRFLQYFNGIVHKTFYLPYLEKGTADSLNVAYTKNELLQVIIDAMSDNNRRKEVANIITDIISGNHKPYMQPFLDAIFRKSQGPDGMRISVYCGDQASYHSEQVIQELYQIFPYLTNFRINDVIKSMCNCWPTKPVKAATKLPYYSLKPALLVDGELDPNCRPLYIRHLQHYMPNAQTFVFLNRGHMVGGRDWQNIFTRFLNDPYTRIEAPTTDVVRQ